MTAGYAQIFRPQMGWRRIRSGKGRWRARLLRGTGTGAGWIEPKLAPHHGGGVAFERDYRCRRLRGINWRAGVQDATEGAAAALEVLRGRPIALGPGRSVAVADHSRAEGVGCRNARRPAGSNRRKNLHREGDQDYGQKVL